MKLSVRQIQMMAFYGSIDPTTVMNVPDEIVTGPVATEPDDMWSDLPGEWNADETEFTLPNGKTLSGDEINRTMGSLDEEMTELWKQLFVPQTGAN